MVAGIWDITAEQLRHMFKNMMCVAKMILHSVSFISKNATTIHQIDETKTSFYKNERRNKKERKFINLSFIERYKQLVIFKAFNQDKI